MSTRLMPRWVRGFNGSMHVFVLALVAGCNMRAGVRDPADGGAPVTEAGVESGPAADSRPDPQVDTAPDRGGTGAEICNNGLDDDGDGLVDEGWVCAPGNTPAGHP